MTRSHTVRWTGYLALAMFILLLSGLFAACAGAQAAKDPAGTATQDPPVPSLTEATHGIVDTTGTIPQSLIEQLRSRSDEVQAQGYQIAVVFFNNLASDPHQFATQVFNKNGIGSKEKNNGVLLVLYLQKPGTDGHAPWLSYITGGGISTALPDTLMDDYVQSTFVSPRAQGHWQEGLLAFYDRIAAAEQDPGIAQEWQNQHSLLPTGSDSFNDATFQIVGTTFLVCLAIIFWLIISAVVAARRQEPFFSTAFRLLGQFLIVLVLLSRGSGRGSRSRGGSGSWGRGGSSPSSGGDV
ncbi:MAG TPA: TPM domain-containing protein [Ktedonobacteraceae bacterium]|nr:TPM domain-containing protein [Ktedonobacteraceae bacterium]